MADIKFSCPACAQHICCDELWGGHQIKCPGCQGDLTVPMPAKSAVAPAPVPVPAPSASAGNPLVPKPPAAARLSLGAQGHPSPTATPAPTKPVPIRKLAPPAAQKENAVLKYAKIAAILAVLGVGGYF